MFMRLVHVKVKPDSLEGLRGVYERRIIPTLESVDGCRFASLVQSTHQPDECISITFWDDAKSADEYVRKGTYDHLLEEASPHLINTTEWKVGLSSGGSLEYIPVEDEPHVSGLQVSGIPHAVPPSENPESLYVRILSLRFKPDKLEDFKEIYESKIFPVLQKTKGCRYIYLTESTSEKTEAISMTIWDSKKDAEEYESDGTFDSLVREVKHLLSGLYQWKMTLGRSDGQNTVTSEDMSAEGYRVISGKKFM